MWPGTLVAKETDAGILDGAVLGHEDAGAGSGALEDAEETAASAHLRVRGHLDRRGHPRELAALRKHALIGIEIDFENRHGGAENAGLHRECLLFREQCIERRGVKGVKRVKRVKGLRSEGSERGLRSLLVAVRDDVIFDAVVDVAGEYAVIEKIPLGAVGAEADDAGGPSGRHAGNLEQFVDAGVVDVDARRGWRSGFGLWRGLRRVVLRMTGDDAQACGEKDNQQRGGERREWLVELHTTILCLLMGRGQEKDLTAEAGFP